MANELQFPIETLRPIEAFLRGPTRVVALSGPVGSGKLTAVSQVARALQLPVRTLFLEHEVDVHNLEARLLSALQPTLEGPTVCCVRSPELIKPRALEALAAKQVTSHCVLLSNEKLLGWPKERLLYQPKPSSDFCVGLAQKLGARDAHVVCTTARGDLRQIAVLVSQDKAAGDGVGRTDATPHAWMDSRDVLAGAANLPSERVLPSWLERNALADVPEERLEEAVAFYDTLVQLDVAGEDGDGPRTAAALATRALRAGLPRLRRLSAPDAPLTSCPLALRQQQLVDAGCAEGGLQKGVTGQDAAEEPSAAPPETQAAGSTRQHTAEEDGEAAATEGAAGAVAAPAPSASTASSEQPRTLFASGSARLVTCAPEVRAATAAGGVFDLAAHAEATTNESARRMTLAILTPDEPLPDVVGAWSNLEPQLTSAVDGIRLWRAPCGMVALLVKKPDARLRVRGWRVQKLRRSDPFPLARALAGCESVGSMDLAQEVQTERAGRVTAARAARHVMEAAPDRDSQLEYMVDLAEAKMNGEVLTPVQAFVLRHKREMKEVVQAARERESLNRLLVEATTTRRFPWDFKLEHARVWYADVKLNVRVVSPEKNAACIVKMAAERAVVFYGPPGLGKTECGRSLAAAMTKAGGLTHFPFVNTVESLRKLSEHSLLKPGAPLCIDEYNPRTTPCGAQGGGVDHLKNVVDSTHTKTIEARFNDFALPGDCPRVITTQSVSKLLPFISNTPTTKELQSLGHDEQAVLRRLIFVHVAESIHGAAAPAQDSERDRKRRRIDALLAVVEESRLAGSGELPPELTMDSEDEPVEG